jgi:hypothetical protein
MPLLDYVIQDIQSNTGKQISLANHNLWDEDVDALINLFNQNKHIISIDLSHNNLRDEGIRKLISLSHVRSLNLSAVVGLNDETAILLIRAKHLHGLDLSRNRGITDVAGEVMLQEASQKILNIKQTSINEQLQEKIAQRILENKSNEPVITKKYQTDGGLKAGSSSAFFDAADEQKDASSKVGEERKDISSNTTPSFINIRSSRGN